MLNASYQQYLSRFAEEDALAIANTVSTLGKTYDYVLTIPAYKEDSAFFLRLKERFLLSQSLLLILVINQPDQSTTAEDDRAINQTLWNAIHQHNEKPQQGSGTHLLTIGSSHVLLIDRFTQGNEIPHKQGVGLARKLACDIACQLIEKKIVRCNWIFTSDADTELPKNYFNALESQAKLCHSAAIYPFRHRGEDNAIYQATALYEKALNYYVAGLQWAGSPYAFHTIGSCIAIQSRHYINARGYPKRAGGEDFYLLNKLAKTGEILKVKDCNISIEARVSDRVPFGTGPAVGKILNTGVLFYYHPEIFVELKQLLQQSDNLWHYNNKPEAWLETLSQIQQQALHQINIERFFQHVKQQIKTQAQCQQHWREWLDAFKTLKLIHAFEINYPKLPINEAISLFAEKQAKIK